MGAKQSTHSNVTYLKLKAKTSETDHTPYFGKQTKEGEKWIITETYPAVDGILTAINSGTYEYEGETKNKCELHLVDADGSKTIVQSNFNNLLYSILNSLAGGFQPFIEIQVYLGKSGYPSANVLNGSTRLSWKYKPEELPRAVKHKVGSKTVEDDTNVVEFWKNVILEIGKMLEIGYDEPVKKNLNSPTTPTNPLGVSEPEKDDLPF